MAWWRGLRREARKKFVRCSGEGFVRGIMLAPREPRRATLIERVIVWSVGRLLYPLGRLAGAMRLASGGLCQLGAF